MHVLLHFFPTKKWRTSPVITSHYTIRDLWLISGTVWCLVVLLESLKKPTLTSILTCTCNVRDRFSASGEVFETESYQLIRGRGKQRKITVDFPAIVAFSQAASLLEEISACIQETANNVWWSSIEGGCKITGIPKFWAWKAGKDSKVLCYHKFGVRTRKRRLMERLSNKVIKSKFL